jgi:hypothetical protein
MKAVKETLDASSYSFSAMKTVFFGWALVLAVLMTVLLSIALSAFRNIPYPLELHNLIINRDIVAPGGSGMPLLLSYYPWPLIVRIVTAVLMYAVYKAASVKMHFSGLLKRICRIWLAGFAFILFITAFETPPYFDAGTTDGGIIRALLLLFVSPQTSMGLYQLQFFCLFFSLVLFATAFLARLRMPLVLGILYGIIGIFFQTITAMLWYIVPAVVFFNILLLIPFLLVGLEPVLRQRHQKYEERRHGNT